MINFISRRKRFPPFLLLSFLLVGPLNSLYSQTGKYCYQDDFWSSCYTFLPDNKFEYTELMCVAEVFGKGNYLITNDTINFHYEPIVYFRKDIFRDGYELKEGIESFKIIGAIGVEMALVNEPFEDNLVYKKISLSNSSKDQIKINEEEYAYPSYFEESFESGYTVEQEDKKITFSKINIGNLKVTSGKIIACDPIVLHDAIPFKYDFPKGAFPVEIAMSKVNGINLRNALVRIVFSKNKILKWEFALRTKQAYRSIDSDELYGYPVDGAMGLYSDKDAVDYVNTLSHEDWEEIFYDKVFSPLKKRNSYLLHPIKEFNLATFDTGYGDGYYGVYIGTDQKGNICQLLTDFGIINWWKK